MYRLLVIGIADNFLSRLQQELLGECTLIVGTSRFRQLVCHCSGRFLSITPLDQAVRAIREGLSSGNVAVLASGDPLFYGIGQRLLVEFSTEQLHFYPALSSLQRACALFRLPWEDAQITSLHGRRHPHLPGLLLTGEKNLVFTDAANSPDKVAGLLLEYLQGIGDTNLPNTIRMLVAENIGLEGEKVFSGTLAEAKRLQFSSLNVICLLVPSKTDNISYRFGLSEKDIAHSRGLITKNEVRAATLHRLQLPEVGILWDIGAGSGSLSLEAARSTPRLTVYAIEHKKEELENIKENIVKFRCHNIVPVFGRAPDALAALPAPDRVFIGGSSGALHAIIDKVAEKLSADGRLVINGVIEKTVQTAPRLMQQRGFRVEKSIITVSRSMADGTTRDFNPITIMVGRR